MQEYKAICLGEFVTAREVTSSSLLLSCASDVTDAGAYIPPQEIYVFKDDIKKLYEWVINGGENND